MSTKLFSLALIMGTASLTAINAQSGMAQNDRYACLVVGNLGSSYGQKLGQAMSQAAQSEGIALDIMDGGHNSGQQIANIENCTVKGARVIFLQSSFSPDLGPSLVRAKQTSGARIIIVGQIVAPNETVDLSIAPDWGAALEVAAAWNKSYATGGDAGQILLKKNILENAALAQDGIARMQTVVGAPASKNVPAIEGTPNNTEEKVLAFDDIGSALQKRHAGAGLVVTTLTDDLSLPDLRNGQATRLVGFDAGCSMIDALASREGSIAFAEFPEDTAKAAMDVAKTVFATGAPPAPTVGKDFLATRVNAVLPVPGVDQNVLPQCLIDPKSCNVVPVAHAEAASKCW